MRRRIGILGPSPSVERILKVAQEFDVSGIEWVCAPYEDEKEIPMALQELRGKVHGWFFSGPVTYLLAKPYLEKEDQAVYCKSGGAGLYLACLQIGFERNVVRPRLSVDVFEKAMDIEGMLQDAGISVDTVFIKEYDEGFDQDEISQFHLKLWQAGKIDAVITPLRRVYYFLQQQGVPVYHLTLTKWEIHQTMELLVNAVKAFYFKNTQVGLVLLEIGRYREVIAKAYTPYDLQYLELKLKEAILPFCKKVDGYLLDKGSGVYAIFSSRGVIAQEMEMLKKVMEHMSEIMNFNAAIAAGIGFGETVFGAEMNANRALANSRDNERGRIAIVQEDGGIVEAASEQHEIRYQDQAYDEVLLDKLHQANVGVKTYSKIQGIVRRMNWDSFTTAQLAEQLSVTERNIHRILAGLCKAELAECIGEKHVFSRGRPSKKYRLC